MSCLTLIWASSESHLESPHNLWWWLSAHHGDSGCGSEALPVPVSQPVSVPRPSAHSLSAWHGLPPAGQLGLLKLAESRAGHLPAGEAVALSPRPAGALQLVEGQAREQSWLPSGPFMRLRGKHVYLVLIGQAYHYPVFCFESCSVNMFTLRGELF